MTAKEIMKFMFDYAECGDVSGTCDTLKAGDPEVQVNKVAVSMFATPEVVKKVSEWGAQLLIVHEPTYYNHWDEHSDDAIEAEKRALIEKSGLVIYRYHDHPHGAIPDMIAAGMLKYMDLDGENEYMPEPDFVRVHLKNPTAPVDIVEKIEKNLGIKHIRICGNREVPCSTVSCKFGTPGGVFEELKNPVCEVLITGEACEWSLGEYARDAAQLGHKKTLLILGHIGSERAGMVYIADVLAEKYPELEVKYFECCEVYTYTDSER